MRTLLVRLAPVLALAVLMFAPAARAADLLYTVSGIHVDATAASASAAEAAAIEQGRPKAWSILFQRVAKAGDQKKMPKLDAAGLRRLMRGYTVVHEKRSTTRYVADVTYTFSPEAVARIMMGISSSYRLAAPGRRILLIPMSPKYSPESGWTSAFAAPRFQGAAVPFAVPTGSAPDIVGLGRLNFDTATWADVQQVAGRIKASEAVLALAIPLVTGQTGGVMTGKVQVWIRRIGIAEAPMKTSVDVPMVRNPTQTYPLAADAAVHAIEVMFSQKPAIDFGPKSTITADVRVDSLPQWGLMQNAMTGLANVSNVQVLAMDIGLVRVSLTYQGSTDSLRNALAPAGVSLDRGGDSGWTMAYVTPRKPDDSGDNK